MRVKERGGRGLMVRRDDKGLYRDASSFLQIPITSLT